MGRVEGQVALVTGAARGLGRSHAVRLAEEGADIIAIDVCNKLESTIYPGATEDDLATTAKLVEEKDRRVLSRVVDVRDLAALKQVVSDGVAEFGHIDTVVANAGIATFAPTWKMDESVWYQMIDINLNGVWKTCAAVIPHLLERGQGGSLVLISSSAGNAGLANLAHYTAAKHGVIGLMRSLAVELAPQSIRVNAVSPANVDTTMIHNEAIYQAFFPDIENPTKEMAEEAYLQMQGMPVKTLDRVDVSNAVLYLASDEARHVTGINLPVDAGGTAPYRIPHGG